MHPEGWRVFPGGAVEGWEEQARNREQYLRECACSGEWELLAASEGEWKRWLGSAYSWLWWPQWFVLCSVNNREPSKVFTEAQE